MNYAPEVAGVGVYTGEFAEYLASVGFDVTVVTTPRHYPGWKADANRGALEYSREVRNGVTVLRCPLFLRLGASGLARLVPPVTFAMSSFFTILSASLRRRPHVTISVVPTLFTAPAAILAARLTGSKLAYHVQDLEVDAAFAVGHLRKLRLLEKMALAVERWMFRRAACVITLSTAMADKLVAKGIEADRVQMIRNWVRLDHLHPLEGPNAYRDEFGLSQDDFLVLYSGNIGIKQDLETVLKAATQLVDRNPRTIFLIAGDGPLKADLEKRYGDLANVRFIPFQPKERYNEFLNLADLHVLPQAPLTAEMVLPSKLGGMLSTGKPIVATVLPDSEIADFVQGAITITPPCDATALAEAIDAASRAEPSPADNARRLAVAQRLSHRVCLPQLAKLLASLAGPVHAGRPGLQPQPARPTTTGSPAQQ